MNTGAVWVVAGTVLVPFVLVPVPYWFHYVYTGTMCVNAGAVLAPCVLFLLPYWYRLCSYLYRSGSMCGNAWAMLVPCVFIPVPCWYHLCNVPLCPCRYTVFGVAAFPRDGGWLLTFYIYCVATCPRGSMLLISYFLLPPVVFGAGGVYLFAEPMLLR